MDVRFHPFNKDLVADPSPKILVIVDSCVEIKFYGAFPHCSNGDAGLSAHRSTKVHFHPGR